MMDDGEDDDIPVFVAPTRMAVTTKQSDQDRAEVEKYLDEQGATKTSTKLSTSVKSPGILSA